MAAMSKRVTELIDEDLQSLGAIGPSTLRTRYPVVKDYLHWCQDLWENARGEIQRVARLCLSDPNSHSITGLGQTIIELKNRRHHHKLAAYTSGVADAIADVQRDLGRELEHDHPIWSEPGMNLLCFAQPKYHLGLWGTGQGTIPWLYAIQEYGKYRTFYAELNDFIDTLSDCEDAEDDKEDYHRTPENSRGASDNIENLLGQHFESMNVDD